ncbi:hypothetical protein EMCG_04556 [[Emmonsia] crescens]|uniref:Uncharacterized protein n=1 Tax=[Emmonsia] crescens TaxID=73230 RepID=A0A0G2HRN4_9EURO|nr:hypothetical protein EMCG_04556 [Emmonsia crescens UAMH 3008]
MMALFNHINRSELAKGNIEPKREAIDRQSVSSRIPPTPRGPNRANRAREGSIFNPQGEASAPPNSPEEDTNEGIIEDGPCDYENYGTSMGGGGRAFDGIPSARRETTPGSDTDDNAENQRSSPSSSGGSEGDPGDYGSNPEGDSTDNVETTTSSTPHSETNSEFDNFQRLDMLVEAAKVFAKATNKRPYPADSGSQSPDSRRRRLSEKREGNGLSGYGDNPSTGGVPIPQSGDAGFTSTRNPSSIFQDSSYSTAEGETESRQQLFPENQPSQPGARRSPRANNTTLLNTAQPPTAVSLELDSNFTLDPTSLDRSALYQSPQSTLSIDTLQGGAHKSLNGEQEARIQAALNAKPFVDPVLMNPMLSHDDPALAPSPEPIIMNQIINDVNDIHRPPSPPSSQVMNELLSLYD